MYNSDSLRNAIYNMVARTGVYTYTVVDDIHMKGSNIMPRIPEIKKVHFSGPVTCVIWGDGSKTTVRCSENDVFDAEKGLAMAIVKKMYGNNNSFHKVFKKLVPKEYDAAT